MNLKGLFWEHQPRWCNNCRSVRPTPEFTARPKAVRWNDLLAVLENNLQKNTDDAALAADARRWRAVCARHGVAMTRMATGSTSYSSHKSQAILDAWADMAAAEVEAFDPEEYMREEVHARTAELERDELKGAGCGGRSDHQWPNGAGG